MIEVGIAVEEVRNDTNDEESAAVSLSLSSKGDRDTPYEAD